MRPAPITSETAWLADSHLVQLEALASTWAPLEVGGILLGYHNAGAAVITHITGPGPNAEHSPNAFHPDHAFHVEVSEQIYRETGGVSRYLGDWHTHPDGSAQLSMIDRRTLRRIARSAQAQCPTPLMMVIAGEPEHWKCRMYITHTSWSARRAPHPVTLKVYVPPPPEPAAPSPSFVPP